MKSGGNEKRRDALARARTSLEGLAIGDAFGETCFSRDMRPADVNKPIAAGPWYWTDDTAMALSIYEVLERHGRIDQNDLAECFASRYIHARNRGYGGGMHRLLLQISEGADWRKESREQFNGGSWGNGSAMRVAPLGAYFADDLARVVAEAALSAEVTHMHPEGIAGAVAIALGAAYASGKAAGEINPNGRELLEAIAADVPDGITRTGILNAAQLPDSSAIPDVVQALGNGSAVSCQDTVPFALWCAAHNWNNYERALRLTASAGGDVDTTCAMVGGIVVLSTGRDSIPAEWRARAEALPQWVYVEMMEEPK